MKIRTDFVTNSSSSSYVTVKIYLKDKTVLERHGNMDDIGHGNDPVPFALLGNKEMADLLQHISNGQELMETINRQYNGMFPDNGDDGDASDEEISAVHFDDVKKIEIHDQWSGDYGSSGKTFRYNPKNGKCTSEEDKIDIDEELPYLIEYSRGPVDPTKIAKTLKVSLQDAQEALIRYYFENSSFDEPEEIAEKLGLSIEMVRDVLKDSFDYFD